jgi:hypothetical protein
MQPMHVNSGTERQKNFKNYGARMIFKTELICGAETSQGHEIEEYESRACVFNGQHKRDIQLLELMHSVMEKRRVI